MDTPPAVKLCSACGVKPRVDQREKSTNTQCSDCKYEGQKRWTMSKLQQEQAQAVVAFREALAKSFEGYKIQRFSGPEIASIIRRAQWPAEPPAKSAAA